MALQIYPMSARPTNASVSNNRDHDYSACKETLSAFPDIISPCTKDYAITHNRLITSDIATHHIVLQCLIKLNVESCAHLAVHESVLAVEDESGHGLQALPLSRRPRRLARVTKVVTALLTAARQRGLRPMLPRVVVTLVDIVALPRV